MRPGRNLKRYYLLLAGCCVMAALYYFVVTRPLVQQERELDNRLEEEVSRLITAGHGMTAEQVARKMERLQADIEAFAALDRDRTRAIRFSPEVEELLSRPFQLMEFDHRKFLVIDRIRKLSKEKKVSLPENWERQLPSPARQQPHQLWAQLAVMEQLMHTVIAAGVESVDRAELLAGGDQGGAAETTRDEVAVRMRLTGSMKAIHNIVMMLPLNSEELAAVEMDAGLELKSSLFLSRFVLRKSSAEKADEVTLDFVASGFQR